MSDVPSTLEKAQTDPVKETDRAEQPMIGGERMVGRNLVGAKLMCFFQGDDPFFALQEIKLLPSAQGGFRDIPASTYVLLRTGRVEGVVQDGQHGSQGVRIVCFHGIQEDGM